MPSKSRIKIRRWTENDIPQLMKCHQACYQDYSLDSLHGERIHRMQLTSFPEGQFLAEYKGQIVGYATSLIVQLDDDTAYYTYSEITGGATFNTHTPSGDTLYGADIAVHPDFRGQGIAGMLYERRRKLLKRYNLRRMVAYGRIPGYKAYEGKLTAEEYVEKVSSGEIKDPALNAHLKAGYRVKKVLLNFMDDDSSLHYSTLLEMQNPDYNPAKRRIAAASIKRPVRKIRVCAAQYMMRRIQTWEDFEQNVDFFVDTADTYHCHFLVFPELFSAQLFSTMPRNLDDRQAIKALAEMSDRYIEMFRERARRYNLYIIGGSHPVLRDGKLYNVAFLFSPSGNVYTQDKLHITPAERQLWGIQPGESIKVFDTPLGRIAIQICYDIEFPEVTRLLTLSGAEVVFVPFSTDEKKAYYRVRYCAQARAVENYIYVVLSGNVGNLPYVRSYLINHGQAAVLTPSDFPFPLQAVLAEAEPNLETVVITDIDLTSLSQQRDTGNVRPLFDRRPDLYELHSQSKIQFVRVE